MQYLPCSTITNLQFNSTAKTIQIHREYNEKLNNERIQSERLQLSVIEAEARLLKVSELLRQVHAADHKADRNVDRALSELQAQNKGLREALGLTVETSTPDLMLTEHHQNGDVIKT